MNAISIKSWETTNLTQSCIFSANLTEVLTQLISINKTIADQSAARLEKFTRIESRVQGIQKVAQGTGFELCSCKNNNPYPRIILVKLQFLLQVTTSYDFSWKVVERIL